MGGGASKEESFSDFKQPKKEENEKRSSVLDKTNDEAPEFLICPLSYEVMRDPVFTADGHTFERHVIEEWLRDHDTNPMTNSTMAHKELTPNFAIREACAAYRQQNPSNAESIKRYKAAVDKVKQLPPRSPPSQYSSSSHVSSAANTSSPMPQPSTASNTSFVSNTSTSAGSCSGGNSNDSSASRSRSFDFADYDASPTNTSNHSPSRPSNTRFNYGTYHQSPTPTSTTSNTSCKGSNNGTQCSLCTNVAVTKSKIGPNEWIKVCDGCSKVVAAQRSHTSSPSSARFRSVSATEAAELALTASLSPTSHGVSGSNRGSNSRIHRHSSSITRFTESENDVHSAAPTMSCTHCRQHAVCQRATDIDGTQLWLCSGCKDTQRQFSQAHAAASPTNTSPSNSSFSYNMSPSNNSNASPSSVIRRQTWSGEHNLAERQAQYSGYANERVLHLQNALGNDSTSTSSGVSSPSQACHNRAWNRAEAMAALEQHEWSRANTATANEMADQITDRYADTIQRGARSPVARQPINISSQQHPANCVCGICAARNKR